jgi:hypothetical protein
VTALGIVLVSLAAIISGVCTCTAWDNDRPAMIGNAVLTLVFAGMAIAGWIEVAG